MKLVLACIAFFVGSTALAAPPSQESVERLLVMTKAESMMESMYGGMEQMMRQGMNQALADTKLSPEQRRVVDTMPAKFIAVVQEEMTWGKLKPLYVQLYQETFEQTDVDGLLAFYATPTGQVFIDKMPIIMQKSMTLTQSLMQSVIPKMTAAMRDAIAEAKAAK